jgi:hypothetical protein
MSKRKRGTRIEPMDWILEASLVQISIYLVQVPRDAS